MKQVFLLLVLVVYGCANPYETFYQGLPDARVRPDYVNSNDELRIFSTDDFDRDTRDLISKGYQPVGQSAFNAGADSVTEGQLKEQASKIGAHIILVSSQFTHSVSGTVPLTLPNTTTSTTNSTATVYGLGRPVTATGRSTTTTYGTQTTYIPYTVNRSDFTAVYFVKARARIGLITAALDDATKRRLETNFGVLVDIVVEDTPAFDADILPGDILTTFNGTAIRSVEHYQELLQGANEFVDLVLNRDGRIINKRIAPRS